MKFIGFLVALVTASYGVAQSVPLSPTTVTLPVAGVFAPENGYDDNDTVQIVVDGILPNACWVIDRTEAKLIGVNNDIVVQQFARKQETEICKDETNLPSELRHPVNFMAEISMGSLPEGTYNIIFSQFPEGQSKVKKFHVSKAPTTEIDSLYYAITTELTVPKVVNANSNTYNVRFVGYLSNPCSEMEDEILHAIQHDVIVLMPKVHKFDGTCMPIAQEFTRNVTLQTPKAGRYLLQIRSANGAAVNKLFTVR
ncbi:MAG: hypothetical protein RJB66_1648 [Pseudomonadota bacterium]|jgi:hypothetical protein